MKSKIYKFLFVFAIIVSVLSASIPGYADDNPPSKPITPTHGITVSENDFSS